MPQLLALDAKPKLKTVIEQIMEFGLYSAELLQTGSYDLADCKGQFKPTAYFHNKATLTL